MSSKPRKLINNDGKNLLVIHILVLAFAALVLSGTETLKSLNSFSLGWLLSTVNLILIWILWKLVFKKKLVALVVFIIVLKYAFLAILLSKLTSLSWLDPLVFALGVMSLLGSIVIFSLVRSKLRS